MNLRDYEYFDTLGELLSFTQVAQTFQVSQPTISYAIKRLENFYDCDLIVKDPSHRSVVLTKEGLILKAHTHRILDEFALVSRAIEHSKQKHMHVGFPPIIRARILSQLLKAPGAIQLIANFDLISGGSSELLTKLLSGHLDFSLIGSVTPLSHPNLSVKLLYKREFYIFASQDHPLAQATEITFEAALNYPFILLEEGFVHMKAFQNLTQKYAKKANVLLHFSDAQTIGQLIKSNIGITLMTDFVPFRDMEGLVKIPLVAEDKELFYVQYAYLKNAVLSEELEQLIVMLDRLAKEDDMF